MLTEPWGVRALASQARFTAFALSFSFFWESMQSPLQIKMNYSVPVLEVLFLLMVYGKFFLFVVVVFFFC